MIDINLEEKLLEYNTVCIFGTIDESVSKKVIRQLLSLKFKFLQECQSQPRVVVLINSSGGYVTEGLAIRDAILAMECTVVTVCIGQASSMAAILLSCGTKNYRFSMPSSEIMIHQPLGGAQGQATDVMIQAEHVRKVKASMSRLLSENTGQPIDRIRRDTERDCYLSAEEAVEYGLIDRVVYNFSEVYDEIL